MTYFLGIIKSKDYLLPSLWFGKKKHVLRTFFNPLAKELKKFGDTGVVLFGQDFKYSQFRIFIWHLYWINILGKGDYWFFSKL